MYRSFTYSWQNCTCVQIFWKVGWQLYMSVFNMSMSSNPAQWTLCNIACYRPFLGNTTPLALQVVLLPGFLASTVTLPGVQNSGKTLWNLPWDWYIDIGRKGSLPAWVAKQLASHMEKAFMKRRKDRQVKQREKDRAWPTSFETPDPAWSRPSQNLIICANLVLFFPQLL